MKMLEDLEEVVRTIESNPGCWSDSEICLRKFIRTHHATIRDMAKRLEAAEMDAARYRWLRDEANGARKSAPMVAANPLDPEWSELIHGDRLDAAIDKARQETVR